MLSDIDILDFIGRIAENKAAILTINKTIEDDLKVVHRIKTDMEEFAKKMNIPIKVCFAIGSFVDGETVDIFLEKTEEALERAKMKNCEIVGISI